MPGLHFFSSNLPSRKAHSVPHRGHPVVYVCDKRRGTSEGFSKQKKGEQRDRFQMNEGGTPGWFSQGTYQSPRELSRRSSYFIKNYPAVPLILFREPFCRPPILNHNTINSVPAPMSTQPATVFTDTVSCRNTNASTSVITTDSLSIGTTFDTSPICSAL